VLVAGQVFGKHVARWIETSQAALCMRCQQIEASGYTTAMLAERADEGAPCLPLFCLFLGHYVVLLLSNREGNARQLAQSQC
jgi:hypothetical protein